jgi:hypothetical protein
MTESLWGQLNGHNLFDVVPYTFDWSIKALLCDFDHKIGAATTSLEEARGESGALINKVKYAS